MEPIRTVRLFGHLTAVLALAFTAARPAAAGAQPVLYSIQDLGSGVFGGGPVQLAINASGQVAGTYIPSGSDSQRAFRTTPTGRISDPGADLGTFGGNQSFGFGINASGQVSGFSAAADGLYHIFRTSATGNLSDPGADLAPGFAYGINASGQVTGPGPFRSSPNGQPVSFTSLGTLGGNAGPLSAGVTINDAGQVTGYATTVSGARHAFRTTATGLVSDPGADLGTLPGGTESFGYGINASGQVVGASTFGSGVTQRAFRTTATGRVSDPGTDLGTLGGPNSAGYGINSLGVLVGDSNVAGGARHAFVYDTQMRDLNSLLVNGSGWVLTAAYGINDAGQIAGSGTFGGEAHAFRLTPVPIPEPSSLTLIGCVAAAAAARRPRWF